MLIEKDDEEKDNQDSSAFAFQIDDSAFCSHSRFQRE